VATILTHSRVIPRGSKYPRFSPYQPPPPPSGSYDPILDAQQQASLRGLGDVRQDASLAASRAAQDYGLGVEGLNRSYGRGMEDFTTSRDRGLADLTTSRDRGLADYGQQLGRGEEDYGRSVGLLQRSYQQLGRRQAEGARTHGVLSGGLALRSAQIRAENQAIDRQPLDTSIGRLRQDVATGQTRLGEDFTRGSTRLGEDYARGTGRLGEDRDLGIGELGLGYDRGVTDRTTAVSRAERENSQFGLDVGAQKAYQAGQSGWAPPGRGEAGGMPKNEFVKPDGSHYKVIISNGWRYEVDPSGRVLNKRKR
jgi:hypothetical protein